VTPPKRRRGQGFTEHGRAFRQGFGRGPVAGLSAAPVRPGAAHGRDHRSTAAGTRSRLLFRALRKGSRSARFAGPHAARSKRNDYLVVFQTLRNEKVAGLAWFLEYYRDLGADPLLMVDNKFPMIGSAEYLAQQPDVSFWSERIRSYKKAAVWQPSDW